jgi:hypothetical protein
MITRDATDVDDRRAVFDDFHLFFETVECAYDVDVEQVGIVFGTGACDGEDLALFLTYGLGLLVGFNLWL